MVSVIHPFLGELIPDMRKYEALELKFVCCPMCAPHARVCVRVCVCMLAALCEHRPPSLENFKGLTLEAGPRVWQRAELRAELRV